MSIATESNTVRMSENGVFLGDDTFPLKTNLQKPLGKTGLNDMGKNVSTIFLVPEELQRILLAYLYGGLEYVKYNLVETRNFR